MSDFVKKLPNWLTFSRLILIPIFVILMHDPSRAEALLATIIFTLAAFTDYVDGHLARRYKAISDFGKLLDPVADKILVMSALVMLVAQRSDLDGEPWVRGWLVVLVLARETWVTGLRAVAAARGIIVPAGASGKMKSALQMIAIVLLLLHDLAINVGGVKITCQLIGSNLLLLSILFSYWGAWDYTREILMSDAQPVQEKPSFTNGAGQPEPAASADQTNLHSAQE
ncbi:MAG: CDP-diacylglycerol--glycerol-3-phosphate 3-phosphatidyltransferase [Oligoflexia bacterium]|nr:CDP-diacylglycerol--glycerol-3-phosphate 3-phosphatidyltransferase [Oligoflexia bacterium]